MAQKHAIRKRMLHCSMKHWPADPARLASPLVSQRLPGESKRPVRRRETVGIGGGNLALPQPFDPQAARSGDPEISP